MAANNRLDRVGAVRRAQRIRDGVSSISDVLDTLVEVQERQDWTTLGYKDFDEYCTVEFGPDQLKLTAERRGQVVGILIAGGMSKRGAAKALGVSEGTVRNDVKRSKGAQNYAPAPADAQVMTSGAVPPADTEDASPVLGEPDVDEQAASTSGTQDSPAADSLPLQAHAGVPAVGGQTEERDEERAGYPETFDDLGCPVCSFTIEVSEEDPDASLSEMYNHIWRQCATGEGEERRRSAHDLLARVRQISPAADPLAPPSPQQPGQDSPTGLEAAQPRDDRSETDFPAGRDRDANGAALSNAPEAPAIATADQPGIDHHDGAGVSLSGEALPVESRPAGALLEDGGTAQDPPSSSDPVVIRANVEDMIGRTEDIEIPRAVWDAMTPAQRRAEIDDIGAVTVSNAGGYGAGILSGAPDSDLEDEPLAEPTPTDRLLASVDALINLVDELDVEAVASMLFPAELENLHQHSEALAAFVAKVSRIRFEALTRTP